MVSFAPALGRDLELATGGQVGSRWTHQSASWPVPGHSAAWFRCLRLLTAPV